MPRVLALLVLIALALSSASGQTLQVKGTVTKHIYKNELLKDTVIGSYELSKTPKEFQLRMYDPSPDIERKILMVCDYKQIYESETIGPNSQGVSKNAASQAWGKFENGRMPNGFQWGMPQMLVLAFHFSGGVSGNTEGINELKEDLIPELAKRRASEESAALKTQLNTNTDGSLKNILFWATRADVKNLVLSNYTDCFLMGILTLTGITNGMPLQVSFTNYYARPDEKGRVQLCPISDFEFDGEYWESYSSESFSHNAYDPTVKTLVNDYRFGDDKPTGYILASADSPPFEGTESYDRILNTQHHELVLEKNKLVKRWFVIGFIILSVVPLWFLIKANRKIKTLPTNSD